MSGASIRSVSVRSPVVCVCLVYGAIFSAAGLSQPYFPIWLAERGLTPSQIALVVSAPLLLRIVVTPAIGAAADRAHDRGSFVRVLALLVFLSALMLSRASGFWTILCLSTLMFLLSQAISPLLDATVVSLVRRRIAGDFGRIRLWGSVSFALASVAGGLVLGRGGADAVFAAFVSATGVLVVASLVLPPTSSRPLPQASRGSVRLFSRPPLLVVFTTAALVLASHGTFNSFGSIYLRDAGYSSWSIGLLWALATSAEIAMFWAGPIAAQRLGPYGTLMLAAGAAALRWSLMALAPNLAFTAVLQLLHAATFSCSYLGLMQFVQAEVPEHVGARAQSAFATVLGLMLAGATLASGPLYRHLGSGAFQVAALLPVLAIALLVGFRTSLRAPVAGSAAAPER